MKTLLVFFSKNKNKKKDGSICRLPQELISSILDYITERQDYYACAQVNKYFYNKFIPMVWHDLYIDNQSTLKKIIKTMSKSPRSLGQHVRHIKLGPFLTDDSLLALIKHVPSLQQLELMRFQSEITETSLEKVTHYCPHLSHFIVECSYETPRNKQGNIIGPQFATMLSLSYYCRHQLKYIKLESCQGLDHSLFFALARCPQLEHITIDSCGLTGMIGDGGASALRELYHLKEFKSWYHTFDHTPFMTVTTDCLDFIHAWPELTSLTLYICPTLNDTKAISFISQHQYLQHLELRDTLITNATLDVLPNHLPVISELVLDYSHHITPAGLIRLITSSPSLIQVKFYGCGFFMQDFQEGLQQHDDITMVTMRDDGEKRLDDDENEVIRLYKTCCS